MSRLRVASLQYFIRPVTSVEQFREQVSSLVETAADYGCKLVLFPEYFTVQLLTLGNVRRPIKEQIRDLAAHAETFVEFMSGLAKQHRLYLLGGTIPVIAPGSGTLHNEAFFFGPDGRVGSQGKLHMTRFEAEDWFVQPRNRLKIFSTEFGKLAISICYDVEFPEIESGLRPLTLNAPDHKGSLAFKYTHAPRNFSGELRGRYQNTYPVNSAVFVTGVDLRCASPTSQTCANAYKGPETPAGFFQYQQPPTAMFLDLSASWRLPFQVTRQALLGVTATNLLDNRVPMFAGVPEIGRLIMTRLQFTF